MKDFIFIQSVSQLFEKKTSILYIYIYRNHTDGFILMIIIY